MVFFSYEKAKYPLPHCTDLYIVNVFALAEINHMGDHLGTTYCTFEECLNLEVEYDNEVIWFSPRMG